jgi:hypothetical protein
VRRFGYLLDRAGHVRRAKALESFVKKAKSVVPLDPAVKPLVESQYREQIKKRLKGNPTQAGRGLIAVRQLLVDAIVLKDPEADF